MQFVDRQPTKPGRREITREDTGETFFATLRRADEPTHPGTPLNAEHLNGIMPSGGIIMWSGAIANIPAGWALCNGQNNTPDLRDRFIVGAGSSYQPGDIGGSASVTLSVAQMPSHTHNLHTNYAGAGPLPARADGFGTGNPTAGYIAAAGGNGGHENRPPFYALAFIMKL